jgi:hypothetical protein
MHGQPQYFCYEKNLRMASDQILLTRGRKIAIKKKQSMFNRAVPPLPPPTLRITTAGFLKITIGRRGHIYYINSIAVNAHTPMLNHFSIRNYQDCWTITTEADLAEDRQKEITFTIIFSNRERVRYSYEIKLSDYELQAYVISALD